LNLLSEVPDMAHTNGDVDTVPNQDEYWKFAEACHHHGYTFEPVK